MIGNSGELSRTSKFGFETSSGINIIGLSEFTEGLEVGVDRNEI